MASVSNIVPTHLLRYTIVGEIVSGKHYDYAIEYEILNKTYAEKVCIDGVMAEIVICWRKDTLTGMDVGLTTDCGNIYGDDIIVEYTYSMLARVTSYMHRSFPDLGKEWQLSPVVSKVISYGSSSSRPK